MLPLGHAAVGYLVGAVPSWLRAYEPPRGWELAALLAGTQAPDLVDKPLAYAGVLPSGRSLAHSLLFVVPLLLALHAVGSRRAPGRSTAFFAVGYLSHLPADAYHSLLAGEWADVGFLLWPAFPAVDYSADSVAPWTRLAHAYLPPSPRPELVVAAAAVSVWVLARRIR